MNHRSFSSLLLAVSLLACPAHADWSSLWSLGTQNWNPGEFGDEAYPNNVSPTASSATERDDDYYFSGTYSAPVGVVATQERVDNF